MKHDPLLNKNWDPPAAEQAIAKPAPRTQLPVRREKHPAISSRILATGISVTAVIGMSTSYTKAQKAEELQKLIDAQNAAITGAATSNTPGVGAQSAPTDLAPAITPNSTPTTPSPTAAPSASSAATPDTTVTTTPNVVQVPVQPAQPAQPAYTPPSQNRGNQSSGGSR